MGEFEIHAKGSMVKGDDRAGGLAAETISVQSVYSHATRMMRLSSMAPPENQGFDARHVSSALSFSAVTFSVRMLVVMLASCEIIKQIMLRYGCY